MRSLRSKIVLLAAVICVIAVLVVTLLSVIFVRNAENQQSEQLMLLLCETGERNINYYFTSVEQSVRKVAEYAQSNLDEVTEEKLQAHVETVRRFFDEIANKTNGVLTYYYRIDPAVSKTAKGFWYTNLDGTGFTSHEVTDISMYDTGDTEQLIWFTVPKATGRGIWLPPYITDNLNKEVISYNIPIYCRRQFVGVIGIEIDHKTVVEQVESIRLYNNGYAFLTDAEGKLIIHPRIDLAERAAEGLPPPEIPEGLLSASSFTTYTYEGVLKEAIWLKLNNGMRLYVSVPERETQGEWGSLLRNVLIAAAAVLVLAVLLTYFFTGRITRPLKQLTEAARKADEGNYDFTLEYRGNDEVGALTRTFVRMAGNMKEHISDLNRRAYVDALTSVRNKGAFTAFIEDLQAKMEKDPENNAEIAVGVIDCDDLKTVNDRYGHDKGDLYLKTTSRMICKIFQHSPVFRIGGDEFAVILRNDDFRNRETLSAALEKAMADSRASADEWEHIHVAMGIALYDPHQDYSLMDTVRRADKTMYLNKRKNKEDAEKNRG